MRASVNTGSYGTRAGCRWNVTETLTCWSQNELFSCELWCVKQSTVKYDSLTVSDQVFGMCKVMAVFWKEKPLYAFQMCCGLWSDLSNSFDKMKFCSLLVWCDQSEQLFINVELKMPSDVFFFIVTRSWNVFWNGKIHVTKVK